MTPEEAYALGKLADDIHDNMSNQVVKGIKVHAGILTRWEQKIRRLLSDTAIVAEAKAEGPAKVFVEEKGKFKN